MQCRPIIYALPPKFQQKHPLLFQMVHLRHRLYGVDAPDYQITVVVYKRLQNYTTIG